MGSYAAYTGAINIPPERFPTFNRYMEKILNYGGIIWRYNRKVMGHDITLICPVNFMNEETVRFCLNYFDDSFGETATYDVKTGALYTGKVGDRAFEAVIDAAYMLYEVFLNNPVGIAITDDEWWNENILGWINHILGTHYTKEARTHVWMLAEYFQEMRECNYRYRMMPDGYRFACMIPEEEDLLYIERGENETNQKMIISEDTYEYDVWECRKALVQYYNTFQDRKQQALENLSAFLKLARKERTQNVDDTLEKIAELSLYMPARVFLYLTAEIQGKDFWTMWHELKDEVYHDEQMKNYPRDILNQIHDWWVCGVHDICTADYLHTTDDDRLYWWHETSEEVIISSEMDKILKKLAAIHNEILKALQETDLKSHTDLSLMEVLERIHKSYGHVYAFDTMFDEFLDHTDRLPYKAAVEMLSYLTDMEKEENPLKNVAISIPVVTLTKRFLAVLANIPLRKKYFEF